MWPFRRQRMSGRQQRSPHATLVVRALSFGGHAPAGNTITLCALPYEERRYFPCHPFLQDTISAIRGQSSQHKSHVSLICNQNRMTNWNSLHCSIVRNKEKYGRNGIFEASGSIVMSGRIWYNGTAFVIANTLTLWTQVFLESAPDFANTLWNQKVHYPRQKNPAILVFSILNHMKPVHTLISLFL
jgi:hypothetical protein